MSLLIAVPAPQAAADWEAWENGKAWTKMLKDAAAVAAAAVTAAAAAVGAAALDLANAKKAVTAASGNPATTAATLAALAEAEAALAAAEAILAAATAASAAAAAAVAGATIGTLLGQGLRGIWSWCWDPVCDLTAVDASAGSIYAPATDQEIDALVTQLLGQTGFPEDIDFYGTGAAGLAARNFIAEGVGQFVGAARGAAAATDGRQMEVHLAMCDLQQDLSEYRETVLAFAQILPTVSFQSPAAGLAAARADFDTAVAKVRDVCDPDKGDDCDKIAAYLDEATADFQSAQDVIAATNFPSLVGEADSLFPDLSLSDFHAFLNDCADHGELCLPPQEVVIADTLVLGAGTYFPSMGSFGPAIAAYDAEGDIGGREGALFDPGTGLINLAELLTGAATTLSTSGYWLNIDLQSSPLAADAAYNPAGCQDCNGNGAYDFVDIANKTSQDVDLNGVPDECQ